MNDVFTASTPAPDNRGEYEKLLPAIWEEAMQEHLKAVDAERRLGTICKTFEITRTQALIVDGAYNAAMRGLCEVFGRSVDETTDNEGLRAVAFVLTLQGLASGIAMLSGIHDVIAMKGVMGSASTPGCDCQGCKLAVLLDKSVQKRVFHKQ